MDVVRFEAYSVVCVWRWNVKRKELSEIVLSYFPNVNSDRDRQTFTEGPNTAIELLEKKLHNLFHLNCGLQIRQIRIHSITECAEYCTRRCTKHASLIWTNWNSDWERSEPSWITSSLWQPLVVSGVVDSTRSVMRVCTPSLPTRCNQPDSNPANLDATVEVG